MTFNPKDDYEALGKLFYPSIEASGNVYYGQTRKLTLDELFKGGFRSSAKLIGDYGDYADTRTRRIKFTWQLGPLSDTLELLVRDYDVSWSAEDFGVQDSSYIRINPDLSEVEKTGEFDPGTGIDIYARYDVTIDNSNDYNILDSGNFNSFAKQVSISNRAICIVNSGQSPVQLVSQEPRNVYLSSDKSALYIRLTASSQQYNLVNAPDDKLYTSGYDIQVLTDSSANIVDGTVHSDGSIDQYIFGVKDFKCTTLLSSGAKVSGTLYTDRIISSQLMIPGNNSTTNIRSTSFTLGAKNGDTHCSISSNIDTVTNTSSITLDSNKLLTQEILPFSHNSYNIGSSIKQFKDIYCDSLHLNAIVGDTTLKVWPAVEFNSTVLPTSGGLSILGNDSARWSEIYSTSIDNSSTIKTSNLNANSITPTNTSNSSLGDQNNPWANLYVSDVNIGNKVEAVNITASNVKASTRLFTNIIAPVSGYQHHVAVESKCLCPGDDGYLVHDLGTDVNPWSKLYVDEIVGPCMSVSEDSSNGSFDVHCPIGSIVLLILNNTSWTDKANLSGWIYAGTTLTSARDNVAPPYNMYYAGSRGAEIVNSVIEVGPYPAIGHSFRILHNVNIFTNGSSASGMSMVLAIRVE